ncbi:MAG: response regulator transcription factor [Pseudomonadota bacterium]|jgi:two-component system OmpR family response regulator
MRVLLVEDDATLADGILRFLEQEGYRAHWAASGEEADRRLGEEAFDLLVLDIGLPGRDGFEVLRRLRSQPGRTLPVLILTARDAVEDRVRGLDLGADDYMVKPFALPELGARLRALGRRRQQEQNLAIRHGPLLLDTAAHRAWLRGEPLELTVREWAVLGVLLSRTGQVVSKEQIIRAITPLEGELSANAVEVYVSRLRTKLEPAGIRIRTVRGFGYVLEEHRP